MRDRLIRLFVPPDAPRDVPFEAPFGSRRYRGNLNSFIDWSVFFYGGYQPGLLQMLRDMAEVLGRERLVFVDVGANVGLVTLFMADHASAVDAFEPFAPLVRRIDETIRLNGLANVTVHPVALGERDESGAYRPPVGANLGTGSLLPQGAEGAGAATVATPVRNGDGYFEAHGIAPVGLIKIDTEGYEGPVLAGLAETLARDRPIVVMEWSPATAAEFRAGGRTLDGLLPARYARFDLVDRLDGLYRLEPLVGTPGHGDLVLIPEERLAGFRREGRAAP